MLLGERASVVQVRESMCCSGERERERERERESLCCTGERECAVQVRERERACAVQVREREHVLLGEREYLFR